MGIGVMGLSTQLFKETFNNVRPRALQQGPFLECLKLHKEALTKLCEMLESKPFAVWTLADTINIPPDSNSKHTWEMLILLHYYSYMS